MGTNLEQASHIWGTRFSRECDFRHGSPVPSTPASPTCPLRSQGTAMAIASRTRAHVPSSLTIPHDLPCMWPHSRCPN